MDEKFWVQDPLVLFKLNIVPLASMNMIQKLNAATRLLVIVVIVLYILGYPENYYLTLLGLGLTLIFIMYVNTKKEGFISDCGSEYNPILNRLNAAYEVTPPIQFNPFNDEKRSYMNTSKELNPLMDEPGFKEIWRAEPEMMGSYSMVPDPETVFPVSGVTDDHPSQEHYIVRSKVDHLNISQSHTDLYSTRSLAEADYNQSMVDFRQGIMNEHEDRFIRERKHGCPDMKLMSTTGGGGSSIGSGGVGGASGNP